jgi:LysM repeat protein
MLAAAESQGWKVRPGDNLDIIAATLEIPKEEIKKHNPEVSETNLQVGRKLKLPLSSYGESKTLEEQLGKKDKRIEALEKKPVIWRNKSLAQHRSCAGSPFGSASALLHLS